MRRAALTLGAVLVLAGCGDADVDVPGTGPDAVPESPAATEEAAVPGADPTSSAEGPADGECQALPTDDDGDYTVGDAGSATVRLEGESLVLDGVTPADGWQHTVDSETATEVEVEFTREDRVLDLEVEIGDDGLPRAEVCADDD